MRFPIERGSAPWAVIAVVVSIVLVGLAAITTLVLIDRRVSASVAGPSAPPVSVLVIGDAQTGCSEASGCGPDTFVGEAAAKLGWDVHFLAAGGYLDAEAPFDGRTLLVAAEQPDLVLLTGGLADRVHAPAQVQAAVAATVDDLEGSAPAADIVVLGPVWESSSAVPADVARTARAIAAGGAAGGATLVLDPVGERWFGARVSVRPGGGSGASAASAAILSPAGHRTVAAQLVVRIPEAVSAPPTSPPTATTSVRPDSTSALPGTTSALPGSTATPRPGSTATPRPGATTTPRPGSTATPRPGDTTGASTSRPDATSARPSATSTQPGATTPRPSSTPTSRPSTPSARPSTSSARPAPASTPRPQPVPQPQASVSVAPPPTVVPEPPSGDAPAAESQGGIG